MQHSESTISVASDAELEVIIFGSRCEWCEREEPCACATRWGRDNDGAVNHCACTCGRCQFDGPLPDDGPLGENA